MLLVTPCLADYGVLGGAVVVSVVPLVSVVFVVSVVSVVVPVLTPSARAITSRVLRISVSCSSELNVASCAMNSPSACGCDRILMRELRRQQPQERVAAEIVAARRRRR